MSLYDEDLETVQITMEENSVTHHFTLQQEDHSIQLLQTIPVDYEDKNVPDPLIICKP